MIPVFKPLLEQEELDAAEAALRMGWLGMGSYVAEFERAIGDLVGPDRHPVAVSTGHAAIHLSLLLMGVGAGDEVITPSFNNITDFQAILATGADIVFCDINDSDLCVDLEKAASLVTPRTKAIIVTDYANRLADHAAVREFADRHAIRVLHDAAHVFGSTAADGFVGGNSDVTIFSFDPVKTVTCIDGGVVIVRTPDEARAVQEMRLVGMGQPSEVMYQNKRAWTYDVRQLGFRYHMANLHAAVGVAQLAKLERIAATRREVCSYYDENLRGLDGLAVPSLEDGVVPFSYYVRVLDGKREAFMGHLTSRGVDTGIHWQPGHWFSLFRDCTAGPLDVTERVGREIVTIPLHSSMRRDHAERVVEAVTSFVEEQS